MQTRMREGRQCARRHLGAEVRAADADVDDMANGIAGVALPVAAAQLFDDIRHLFAHRAYFWHDVGLGRRKSGVVEVAQGWMEDGALFADVDLVSSEQAFAPTNDVGGVGQRDEMVQRILIQTLLRKIE